LRACIEDAMAHYPEASVQLMLKARHSLGLIASAQGNTARAVQMGKDMLALAQQHNLVIAQYWACNMVGSYALRAGDVVEAEQCFDRMRTLAAQTGSRTQAAYAMTCLGYVAFERGDLELAAARQEQALALWRETGVQWAMDGAISGAAMALGLTVQLLGDDERSAALEAEAAEIFRRHGDTNRAANALLYQGRALLALGDLDGAAECWRDSLALCHDQEIANPFLTAIVLAELAEAAHQRANATRFVRLAGAAARDEALVARESYLPFLRRDYSLILSAARAQSGDPALAAAWAEGRGMTVDQAVACALADG
jgi:tetratricopeptide (TPR) repeat protein